MLAERSSTELGSDGAGLQSVVGDVGHELFAVGVRYRNQLIAEDDLAPFYDANVVYIHNIRTMDAHKLVGWQRCFHCTHGNERDDRTKVSCDVNFDVVFQPFNVENVGKAHANQFIVALNEETIGSVRQFREFAGEPSLGFLHRREEILIVDGLKQIVQCVGFPSLQCIVRIGGGERQCASACL